MSYSYKSQSQGAWQLSTASGNMDISPAGTLSLKGYEKGSDIQNFNAKLQDISDASFTTNHVLYWDGSNIAGKADATEAITCSQPLVRTADDIALSVDDAFFGLNGSNELTLDNACITATELANNAVETAKVLDGAITGPKLASDCITSAKLADDAVGAEHIQDDAVGSAALADGAVVTAALADDAVTSAKLADNLTLVGPSVTGNVHYNSSNANADADAFALYHQTSNNTPAEVTCLTLADGDVYHVSVKAAAKDGTAKEYAAYEASALFSRDGASSARETASNVAVIHEDDASWAFDLNINASHQVYVQLTGDATNATTWSVKVDAVRVA